MEHEFISIQEDMEEVDLNYEEIRNLVDDIENFNVLTIVRENNKEDLLDLYTAIGIFETCIIKLKSLISEEKNSLVKSFSSEYKEDLLEKYTGNFMSFLDKKIEGLNIIIKDALDNLNSNWLVTSSILETREKIRGAMRDLVITPLTKSVYDFKSFMIKNKEKIKDGNVKTDYGTSSLRDLFGLFVFFNMIQPSKIKGADARKMVSLTSGLSSASIDARTFIKPTKKSITKPHDTEKPDSQSASEEKDFSSLTDEEQEEEHELD